AALHPQPCPFGKFILVGLASAYYSISAISNSQRSSSEDDMASTRKAHVQTEMMFRTRGGRRPGAGRPAKGSRASERHKARPVHNHRHPVHVTIRVVAEVASLRRRDTYLQL